jgi:glutamate 5-kinase
MSPTAARKRWLAGGLTAKGFVTIDGGAERALLSGKSLLPAGVVSVEGDFDRGDVVIVRNNNGAEIARGLVAYQTDEARMLTGRRTVEIESILGYRGRSEMIHRADLVLTGANKSGDE